MRCRHIGLLLGFLLGKSVCAEDIRPSVASRLSRTEREALTRLPLLQPSALADLETRTDPDRLRSDLRAMDAALPWALSLRDPGQPSTQTWIRSQLSDLSGLEWSGVFQQQIPVPVDQGATLDLNGDRIPLAPFWPNGMMPNRTPAAGLTGPLVDIGDGSWESLTGKELEGSIVLMDFKGGRNWNRVFRLGAQAVIVVEDPNLNRSNAERFFSNTPLPFPRFYVNQETGARIRKSLPPDPPPVTLHGGSLYETRIAESIFAYLPAHPSTVLPIRDSDLLDRIAAQFELSPSRLREWNDLEETPLRAGQTLLIPGQEDPYVIPPEDLFLRLAREYGVEPESLRSLNPELDTELPPGSVLRIPPLKRPVLVLARIDGVSSLPSLPHGAQAQLNTHAAMEMLRMAAEMPEGSRRRGLVVGFIEGDTYGGRVSRRFLETFLDQTGRLEPSLIAAQQGMDAKTLLRTYREVGAWLESDGAADLSESAAFWFVDEWFQNIFNQYRIEVAEARVNAILDSQEARAAGDTERESDSLAVMDRMDRRIDEIIAFRTQHLGSNHEGTAEKAAEMWKAFPSVLTSLEPGISGWTAERLRDRLLAERDAEDLRQSIDSGNREVVTQVLNWLTPDGSPDLSQPVKGIWLDLSDGSSTLELAPLNADYRQVFPYNERTLLAQIEKFDRAQAVASLQAGWDTPWSFVGNNAEAAFSRQQLRSAPSYLDFWAHLGVGLLTLRPANDARSQLDTPLDILPQLDLEASSNNLRTALFFTGLDLQDARAGDFNTSLNTGLFSRLTGTTTKFNIRSGIDAKDPVPHTLVSYPAILKQVTSANGKQWGAHNTATFRGHRIGVQEFSMINGRFSLPLELLNFSGMKEVQAYRQDPDTGLFDYVFDAGQIGTQIQSPAFDLLPEQDTFKNLILFPLYPFVIGLGVEPMRYSMPAPGQLPVIQDAVLKGRPRHVNLEHPRLTFGEQELSGMILYMEPGRRLTMIDKRAGAIRGLLLGSLPEDDPTALVGEGIPIGPQPGDRNLVLPLSPYHVARSMQEISERRVDIYNQYGIRDPALSRTLELSASKLAEAEAARAAKDWQTAIGRSREAWGMLVKSYPVMLKLGREAVLSVVILMALLVPTAAFLERLIIGGKTVVARIAGTGVLFSLGTLFLNFFHPAFQIATSPFIVVIAFAMILMATMVLGICYQRFEILVRRARIAGGEAESEEISLASTLNTAFNLGVSNLKKRPTRTLLTAFTVTVLTFSIVTFVSVRGQDSLVLRPTPLDLTLDGSPVPAETIPPPAYNGVLFRAFTWAPMSIDFIEAVETEFGSRFALSRRVSFIEVAGGNNASREGVNQLEITRGDRKAIVTALMGFEPSETEFTGLQTAVSGNQWFRDAAPERGLREDRFHIILPGRVAEELDITTADLLEPDGTRRPEDELPTVSMMGNHWKVIGILDTEQADRIRDINGESPALVDYLKSAITPQMGSGNLEAEGDYLHMSWRDLALIPVAARRDVGADWLSLAVKFPPEFDFASFRDELARRIDTAVYANVEGDLFLLSPRKQRSVAGLAKILVPVLLCVLIVSNTMMGTIEERVGEVKMLGAIGLSPSQISFLLLSESTVFSCIGIIFGTFAGLIFSKLTGAFGGGLEQLSFNFTSLASTALAMGTGGIVLLATLIPARKASAMAAPSGMEKWELPEVETGGAIDFTLPFTLTAGNAAGMAAFFQRFLLNHIDSSSKDFISRDPRVSPAVPGGSVTRAGMLLAPYDLDVSQQLTLRISPTGTGDVYGVHIHLQRISGSEDAWLRTNYAFLNLVRKQFLLWRNLESGLRRRYILEGQDLLRQGVSS